MYKILAITDGVNYVLHNPLSDDLHVLEPKLCLEVNTTGILTFCIPYEHPNRGAIKKMVSDIVVLEDGEEIYRGRPISDELDFYQTGEITCEGELAYLLDSIQRPYEYKGSVYNLFKQIVEIHNGQVEERKRFSLGNCTVADKAQEMICSKEGYVNSLTTICEELIKHYQGYVRVRRENGMKYLDYVSDYGRNNSQVIRFGENMLDLTKYTKASEVRTVLIPLGEEVEVTRADGTQDKERVTIKSVNGGKDYIIHRAGVSMFGQIWDTVEFEETQPENLLKKAKAYLEECVNLSLTIELSAVDLHMVDVDIEKIQLGDWIRVVSKPHGVDKLFLVKKYEIDMENPENNKITLGDSISTFTSISAKEKLEFSNAVQSISSSISKDIQNKVENATQLITGGRGGYVLLDIEEDNSNERLPWRILIMDRPDKNRARSIIQLNKNGIGFSTTGINGPYRNAWTIDGNLVADFITAGTMLADRIRGGVLEVGGSGLGRSGKITVKTLDNQVVADLDHQGLKVYLGSIQGSHIQGCTIEGNTIHGGTITGTSIEGGTITGNAIQGGTVDGTVITGTKIKGGSIQGSEIETDSLYVHDGIFEIINDNDMDHWNRIILTRRGTHEVKVQPGALYTRVDNGFVDISGGYIHNTSNIDCDGNVSAQGVVKAGGVVLTSDQKQKKEIEDADINKVKRLLLGLKTKFFRYKQWGSVKDEGIHCGFLFQDVGQEMETAGLSQSALCKKYTDQKGTTHKTIAYLEFIPMCILLIQDLYKELEKLKGGNK